MGSLPAFAVKRWQFTLVVFGMMLALGVSSLVAIPKSEDPTFPIPTFLVVAVLPGASPADLEELVVDPIEEKVQGMDEIDRVVTEIRDGLALVRVEFDAHADAAQKEDDVRREIEGLRADLPPTLARLDIVSFNAANVNIIEVGLVSETAPYAELDRLARALERRLEAVAGAGEATIGGIPDQEVRVALDTGRMRALGLSPLEVIGAVNAESVTIPAGSLDAGERRFTVQTSGDYESVDAIRDTTIRSRDGRAVSLGDVAEVRFGDAEPVHLTRVDGKRAAVLAIHQQEGANIFDVKAGLETALDEFEETLPAGVTLARTFDQSENVEHRLFDFGRDFALAIFLVLITLLPLGVRASVVVMVSIPLSIAMGLTMLFAAGYGVNQLSVVGFVIALGLLVDDSVVVIENITRFVRLGRTPLEAAVAATKQITPSVLGCTATLILAFAPLLALPGAPGLFIRSMPLAVVFTVAASLLVSLTIVPFLASRILKPEKEHGNIVFRAMTRLIEAGYRPVLALALRFPKSALAVAGLLIAGSFALVPSIGFSVFPKAGSPQFLVKIETAEGSSLAEADRATRFVEDVLARHPEIEWTVSNVGKGNPMVYYNVAPQNERANIGEVFASFHEFDPEDSPVVLDRIREELARYPGASIRVHEFENGPSIEAPIAIRLLGDDMTDLRDAAAMVEREMRATAGTRDVQNPAADGRTDLRVRVDETRAAALGVAVPDVDRAVRLALGGIDAGRYRHPGDEVGRTIRVVIAREGDDGIWGGARPSLEALQAVFVPASNGGAVPLDAVADVVLEPSPTTIRHYDSERSATITAFTQTGANTARVTEDLVKRLDALSLPPGIRLVVAGEVESSARSFGGIGSAIIIAAFGILAILVLEFRTFRGTLIVASVVPLGVVGGLAALFITGNTLSFTAAIGFVALMGIEVKNSILLVDFTNQLREQGLPLDEAIQKAGETRFVPILLTTLTAMGGLLPLALERSPLYSPLAWVILGGLISSTFLARIVTPVMYRMLPPALAKEEKTEAAEVPALDPLAGH